MLAATGLLILAGLCLDGVAAGPRPPAGDGTADGVAGAPDGSAILPRSRLRVVTFNLFHGGPLSGLGGDDRELEGRLEIVAQRLSALEPDVVGLQEASIGRGRGHVAARLAGRLGLRHVHAAASERLVPGWLLRRLVTGLMNFAAGPAILSRFPIVGHAIHDLPRCARVLDSRVLLRADLATPRGVLRAYSTHTSHDPCQLERVGEIVSRERGPLPSLVTGDLNATEGMPALAALATVHGFVDVFRRANPDAAGATVWQRIEVPTPTAYRRVDYIFLVPGTGLAGRVITSRVALDTPGTLPDGRVIWPSDHYAVVADIELDPDPSSPGPAPAREPDRAGAQK
jgi:endonuclease/exonuclease/phosphatase family metal-dependent hydrolase